jgi:hypothetical protein
MPIGPDGLHHEPTVFTPETVTWMIKRRLLQAAHVLTRTDLESYPGEAKEVEQRLLAECIGWASR